MWVRNISFCTVFPVGTLSCFKVRSLNVLVNSMEDQQQGRWGFGFTSGCWVVKSVNTSNPILNLLHSVIDTCHFLQVAWKINICTRMSSNLRKYQYTNPSREFCYKYYSCKMHSPPYNTDEIEFLFLLCTKSYSKLYRPSAKFCDGCRMWHMH